MKNKLGNFFRTKLDSSNSIELHAELALILEKIRKSESGTLVVLDTDRVVGTITNGDLLKFSVENGKLPTRVSEVMNAGPTVVLQSDLSRGGYEIPPGLRLVPIVNEDGLELGALVHQGLRPGEQNSCAVLVVAGGRGERLRPVTDSVPKPLIPVGGVPILERLLTQFVRHGFREFYIAISYLGSMIRDYFGDGSAWGVTIEYIEEESPLGTAGALGKLPREAKRVLLTNADLLTRANFAALISEHIQSDVEVTMLTREVSVRSEFGLVTQDHFGRVTEIKEKPVQTYVINAGAYVIELDRIRSKLPEVPFSATDLIEALLDAGDRISSFESSDLWMDIGRPDDLERANKAFNLIDSTEMD